MKKIVSLLIVFLCLISGCSNNDSAHHGAVGAELIDVLVELDTQPIRMHDEVIIKAKIMQGQEIVTDATEVKFEIWRDGEEDSEMIEGELHTDEEVYFINKIFHEPGLYYVIAHVTARNMHSMPRLEVEVLE